MSSITLRACALAAGVAAMGLVTPSVAATAGSDVQSHAVLHADDTEFSAAKRGGGKGGAKARGGAKASKSVNRNVNRNVSRNVNVNRNVKRDVNVNRNIKRDINVNRNVNVRRTNVVVRPVRVWAPRPYYGTIIGGVALGTIIAATAVGAVPVAPAPNMCWFWADEVQSRGYWDYCVVP